MFVLMWSYVSRVVESLFFVLFFFKQKTAYEMRISDWSSDVCSSDLISGRLIGAGVRMGASDFAAAERLLERAEAELSRVPARRFATALEIARARLAALKGDAREALSRINAAKAHCPTRLPVDRKSTRLNSSH